MRKHLFFICPTDFIEPAINHAFGEDNYYLSSLGNSIAFDPDMVSEVNDLLQSKSIKDISFVLSDDNRMISDALGNKKFSAISGLDGFYRHMSKQKACCEGKWPTCYHQFLISCYYLHHKTLQLRVEMGEELTDQVQITAKIYKREEQIFRDIQPISILRNGMALN